MPEGFFPHPVVVPRVPTPEAPDDLVDAGALRAFVNAYETSLEADDDAGALPESGNFDAPANKPDGLVRRRRRCLVNIVAGPAGEDEHALTRANHRAYARRCGARHVVVRVPAPDALNMTTECHWKYAATTVAARYEQTLLLDNDCVVTRSAPDLFEMVPVGVWGVVDELQHHVTADALRAILAERAASLSLSSPRWQANGGVLLMPRDAAIVYKSDARATPHWINDQALLSIRLAAGLAPYRLLDGRANVVWVADGAFDLARAWIIHRAGFSHAYDRAAKLMAIANDVQRFGLGASRAING